jgi:propionyl-CoA synthetase
MRVCVVARSSFGFNRAAYLRDVKQAREDPEAFWTDRARAVEWATPPTQALPKGDSLSWFPGGRLNTAHAALDRHVEAGRGGMEAVRFDSLVTGEKRSIAYASMQKLSSSFARVLQQHRLEDAPVMLYMPTLPEALVAMLGAARVGAPHCVVFAGFAAAQLAARIDHVKPGVLVTCDYALEGVKKIDLLSLVRQALQVAQHQPRVLVLNRGSDRDARFGDFWSEMESVASESVLAPKAVPSDHPLYYLHTSGTTGAPKALLREHGSHAVALRAAGHDIMGLGPGQVMWAASDIGWVVGHSFSVYGPLLCGATSLLVEGKPVGTPDHLEW